MKKTILLFPLLLLFFTIQGHSQNDCGLYISTNFDSECIITHYPDHGKPEALQDESMCFLACQGSAVRYYAMGMGSATFEWEVLGTDNWQIISGGSEILVHWPDNIANGNIILTATNNNTGQSCTFNRCIEMIEKPQVGIESFPVADISGEIPMLSICLDQTVEFLDNSTASASAPLVGYFWELHGPMGVTTYTTPNFDFTFTQPGQYYLVHEVINECGCRDIMKFEIFVDTKPALKLDCFGTTCANTTQIYYIEDFICHTYNWEITGGDLVAWDPPKLEIAWDSPESGFGIIRLSGEDCENLCGGSTYVTIPIMSDQIQIEGPETACVGDIAQYELPLFGATEYTWQVTGPGFETYNFTTPNQRLVKFNLPGTYTIEAEYNNEVLPECGNHIAHPLEVVVKDTFSIEGPIEACMFEPITFISSHDAFLYNWTVYNDNETVIATSSNTLDITASFNAPGVYTIEASNPEFCKNAKAYIKIHESPEVLPITNITGDQLVCPNSTHEYTATPTNPLYYIEWSCNCGTPSEWSGEEYAVTFGNTPCYIGAYQVNRLTGCRSHMTQYSVQEFQPTVNTITVPSEVCANNSFNASIQPEENILYEWHVTPSSDASVLGDIFNPAVNILVNDIDAGLLTVEVARSYCGTQDVISADVNIVPALTPIFSVPSEICENEYMPISITNASSLNGTFQWTINGQAYSGANINPLINFNGEFEIELIYTSTDCGVVTVIEHSYAVPAPDASTSVYEMAGGTFGITVSVQDDVSGIIDYAWNTGATTPTLEYVGTGSYSCTVTNGFGCQTVVVAQVQDTDPANITGPLFITRSNVDVCDHYEFTASGYTVSPVAWEVHGPNTAGTTVSGTDNEHISVDFNNPGLYEIAAAASDGSGGILYGEDHIAIPVVPAFNVLLDCDLTNSNNILLSLDDLTAYLDGAIISTTWLLDGVPQTGTAPVPAGGTYTIELIKTYTYTHPQTGEVFSGTCSVSQTINTPPRGQAAFSVPGGPNFCVNNSVQFVDESIGNIIRWEWAFGDNSYYVGQETEREYNTAHPNYQPTLTITDSYGCTDTEQHQITVHSNNVTGSLETNSGPFCDLEDWPIEFNFDLPPIGIIEYTIMPEGTTGNNNPIIVNSTGDYYVIVENTSNNCRFQSNMLNIGFLNRPTASIHGLTSYCFGEEVNLIGNCGDQFNYEWTYNQAGGSQTMANTPDLAYTPNTAGLWENLLTVSYNHGVTTCEDSEQQNITVYPQSPAPQLVFGSNECLTEGPVELISNQSGTLWSNGQSGTSAMYYSAGIASAHYLDNFGCESAEKTIGIATPPDFDGILTGCYRKCPEWFEPEKSIYAFISHTVPLSWDWLYNYSPINSGSTPPSFTMLDLPWFGEYYMKMTYGNNCPATSPILEIDKKKKCDSIPPVITKPDGKLKCFVKNCIMYYEFSFVVENQSTLPITVTDIYYPESYNTSNNLPVVINPGGIGIIYFTFDVPNVQDDHLIIPVVFEHGGNTYTTTVDLFPGNYNVANECYFDFCDGTILNFDLYETDPDFKYKFNIAFESGMENVLVTTEAGIINYDYNPASGEIIGTINFSPTWVANYCVDPEHPDFCFTITACLEDKYCITTVCISQAEFCNTLRSAFIDNGVENNSDLTRNNEVQKEYELSLTPNPADVEVQITGKNLNEINNIICLSLQGEKIFQTQSTLIKLDKLTPGTYLIAVEFINGDTKFLKLIKQ